MASKATQDANHPNWLSLDKFETEIWLHANGRYAEIGSYDHNAPKHRRWTITVIDRETGAKASLSGETKFVTRDLAFAQIDAMADDRAAKLTAA